MFAQKLSLNLALEGVDHGIIFWCLLQSCFKPKHFLADEQKSQKYSLKVRFSKKNTLIVHHPNFHPAKICPICNNSSEGIKAPKLHNFSENPLSN